MILFIPLVSPFLTFFIHLLFHRVWGLFFNVVSNQKTVMQIVIFSSLLLTIFCFFITEDILSLGYIAVCSFLLGYVYFHFFNMSETARRIRILIGLFTRENFLGRDLSHYGSSHLLKIRIERLEKFGVLKKDKNNFYYAPLSLLLVASLIILKVGEVFGSKSDAYERSA